MRGFFARLIDRGSGFSATLKPGSLTTNRDLTLPNKAGTLAITDDITSAVSSIRLWRTSQVVTGSTLALSTANAGRILILSQAATVTIPTLASAEIDTDYFLLSTANIALTLQSIDPLVGPNVGGTSYSFTLPAYNTTWIKRLNSNWLVLHPGGLIPVIFSGI